MKLTKLQLKQIIKEELNSVLGEMSKPHVGEWIVAQLTKPYHTTQDYDDSSLTTTPINQMKRDPSHGNLVKDEMMADAIEQGYSAEEFNEYWSTSVETAMG